MQGSPERQALEETLQNDQAGSVRIQALASYAALKDAEYRLAHLRWSSSQFRKMELVARKTVIEYTIESWAYGEKPRAYREAFASAGEILKPYYDKHKNPGQEILDDLKEINWEKSKYAAFIKLHEVRRRKR